MADVQSRLSNWSTNESSNAPTGPTVIGSGLDDNLRQIQATVRAELANKGLDIASAATTDVGAVVGSAHNITGSTTITNLGTVSSGIWKVLQFNSTCVLKGSVSLVTPNSQGDITAAPGDCAFVYSEGSGVWRVPFFQKQDGTPIAAVSNISTATPFFSALTAETAIATGDYIPAYDVSAAANRKFTVSDVFRGVNALTEDTSPDNSTDFLLTYDISTDLPKKAKFNSFAKVNTGTSTSPASGTSVTFTGIPSTAKMVIVSMAGLSLSGTSTILIQLGTSGGGVETSGYNGGVGRLEAGTAANATTGFQVMAAGGAALLVHGQATLVLLDAATNTWSCNGSTFNTTAQGATFAGTKALAGTLDRIRLISANSADTFDAGTVNIAYV